MQTPIAGHACRFQSLTTTASCFQIRPQPGDLPVGPTTGKLPTRSTFSFSEALRNPTGET